MSFTHTPSASTIQEKQKQRQGEKTLFRQLKARLADPDARTDDGMVADLRASINPQPGAVILGSVIPVSRIGKLKTVVDEFLRMCEEKRAEDPESDVYDIIDKFRHKLNESLPDSTLCTVTGADFDKDFLKCQKANEAVFQRTIMINAIDRWRLSDIFDYECEMLWSAKNEHALPSSGGGGEKMAKSKPDLAVYFSSKCVRKEMYEDVFLQFLYDDLHACVFPDQVIGHCFPFLFIEAKAGEGNLTDARSKNMYHASQALYNIYICMKRAKCEDALFKKVRVFSITLNAKDLAARIHRAEFQAGRMFFTFDDIYPAPLRHLPGYNGVQLMALMKTIFNFAKTKLLPELQKTYQTLVEQYAKEKGIEIPNAEVETNPQSDESHSDV